MNRWVLLRGLTRDCRHWGEFPDRIRAAIPDAEVLPLDLAGNGRRCAEISPDSVASMVEDYRGELRRIGATPPYQLLALSLGAMVGVEWAHRYPQEIERSVLINTSLRGVNPFLARLRPRQYGRLLRAIFSRSAASAEAAIMAMTSARSSDPPLLAAWVGYRREQPVTVANTLRQLRAASRYHAPPAAPGVPTLLLASVHDQLVNVACSRQLARRFGWPLVEHPAAGHDLPLDDGPWVAAQVERWLSEGRDDAATGAAAPSAPPRGRPVRAA